MRLLDTTTIRVGNDEYVHSNGSFGLTTLRDRHVSADGSHVRFRFRGKGGKMHDIELEDARMARVVRRCEELPGQNLFQYLDDDGEPSTVNSEDVNDYLQEPPARTSPPRISAPGQARYSRRGRSRSKESSDLKRKPRDRSSPRSSRSPRRSATPPQSAAAATSILVCSRPTSTARSTRC